MKSTTLALSEVRAALCAIGTVDRVDGHDVIRRDSVIELVDRRRTSLAEAMEAKSAAHADFARRVVSKVTAIPSDFTSGGARLTVSPQALQTAVMAELENDRDTQVTEHQKNQNELIAHQAMRIAELEKSLTSADRSLDSIRALMVCIGGPLNNNRLSYSRAQRTIFHQIESYTFHD